MVIFKDKFHYFPLSQKGMQGDLSFCHSRAGRNPVPQCHSRAVGNPVSKIHPPGHSGAGRNPVPQCHPRADGDPGIHIPPWTKGPEGFYLLSFPTPIGDPVSKIPPLKQS
jgi:hypothetical protein